MTLPLCSHFLFVCWAGRWVIFTVYPALTWVALEYVNGENTCITGEPFHCLTGLTGAAPTPTLVSVLSYSKLIQVVDQLVGSDK